jgi:membrane associated rhomboid family serine protease
MASKLLKPPVTGLRDVLFGKQHPSATVLLLATNIAVAAVLLAVWREGYGTSLRGWMVDAWHSVHERRAYGRFLPTLFLHVNAGHLAANMMALLAASGAVEFLAGGRWAVAVYFVTGLVAAVVSYLGHGAPPLSVGSSGAVFGLLGCTVAFIARRRSMFNYAKRWKVWRVYIPLFVLLFAPALGNADVHAHAGGFACGLILGVLMPPHPRVKYLGTQDSIEEAELPDLRDGE